MIAFAAQQEGVFLKNNLQVEIVSFRSEVEKDNAMLAGELDGVIEGSFGAVNLNKDEETCKLVGHSLMPRMFNIIVSSSSGISSPSQLKGKEIAISTGTIMEYAVDRLLTAEGVDSKDVVYVNVPNMPLRLEMLNQGKIPAALFTSPLSDQAVIDGNILLIDDTRQLLGGPGIIFSTAALKNKSESIRRFIQSWQETVRMINAEPDQYRGILASTAKASEELAAGIEMPVFPEFRLPTQDDLDKINTWMKSKGLISQDVPYNKVVDTQYLQ